MEEKRTAKQIIYDWWIHDCGGIRIPAGEEVSVFGKVIGDLNKEGYTRSQIERLASCVVEYGINKQKMKKWKQRAEILHRDFKKAVSLELGGQVSANTVETPPDDVPNEPIQIEDLREETETKPTPRKPKLKKYTPNPERLELIKNKFRWQADDEDLF
jgi:hypothetical protein